MKAAMAELKKATATAIAEAAAQIRAGRLVAFGTETVYGLGGNATDDTAVARIFAAKGRPAFNPLISHLPDAEAAFRLGRATALAEQLAQAFWPGPMTLVLDQIPDCPVSPLATSGLDSIALRVPAAATARRFLRAANVPVAAPSANRSGRISPTRADHVMDELGEAEDLALILDGGAAEAGLESTVIDARGVVPVILRPGSITAAMIKQATAITPARPGQTILSPGQLESHYAPATPLHLNQQEAGAQVAWIGFGPGEPPRCQCAFNLSPSANLIEAAANLYHLLREADASGAAAIAVAPIPADGIGAAINDRLTRAATPTSSALPH